MNYFLALDCETGGLDHRLHPLMILYLGLYNNVGKLLREREYYFDAPKNLVITSDALAVNKINLVEFYAKAQNRDMIINNFIIFMSGCETKPVPIGWNIAFDYSFIHNQLIQKSTWDAYVSYRYIDVQVLSRFFFEQGSLEYSARELNIPINAHDAKSDATATFQIYQELNRLYKPRDNYANNK